MAARTAVQRRSSSAVEMGLLRRSDNCILALPPALALARRSALYHIDHAVRVSRKEATHVRLHGWQRQVGIDVAEAALVGGDEDVVQRPERMLGRQRLLGEHIERRAGDAAALQHGE